MSERLNIAMIFGNVRSLWSSIVRYVEGCISENNDTLIENNSIEIVMKGISGMKESFLIDDFIGTTYTQLSSWFVVAPNETVGNFKATVMIHDKVNNDIFSLQSTLTFDYTDPLNEVDDDNGIILAPPVALELGIDANKQLYATITGMHVTNNERIHFCFERCANNPQTLTLDHLEGEGTIHEPTIESEATVTLDHLEGEGTVHEVTAEEVSSVEEINYGLLYNWYAATDVRGISSSDNWRVATGDLSSPPYSGDYGKLMIFLDPNVTGSHSGVADDMLRDTSYWDVPGTNIVGFNARGSGNRNSTTNVFSNLNNQSDFWAKSTWDNSSKSTARLTATYFDQPTRFSGTPKMPPNNGASIRLIKTSTSLSHGETGTYTGNDGKVYRTICIGTQEWLADNLAETKYRNGDSIPEVTDNAAWASLTTGALCAYENDWDNV